MDLWDKLRMDNQETDVTSGTCLFECDGREVWLFQDGEQRAILSKQEALGLRDFLNALSMEAPE